MLQLGIKELAKYPFLAETGDYLRDKGFNLEQGLNALQKDRTILENLKLKEESIQSSLKIIQDLFSIRVEMEDDRLKISISDYLKRAAHFNEREWKLVNRRVENGYVYLSSH